MRAMLSCSEQLAIILIGRFRVSPGLFASSLKGCLAPQSIAKEPSLRLYENRH